MEPLSISGVDVSNATILLSKKRGDVRHARFLLPKICAYVVKQVVKQLAEYLRGRVSIRNKAQRARGARAQAAHESLPHQNTL